MTMTANDEFAERLARVQANRGRSVIMVGRDESFVHERARPVKVSRQREVAGSLGTPLSWVMALVLGMAAAAAGMIAQFHLLDAVANPDAEMAMQLGIGLCLTLALSIALRLTTKVQRLMQVLGVVVMVGGFHNLYFWAPALMVKATSAEHVMLTSLTALPNSVRVRGDYIALIEPTALAADPVAEAATLAPTTTDPAVTCAAAAVKRVELTGETRKAVAAEGGGLFGGCP